MKKPITLVVMGQNTYSESLAFVTIVIAHELDHL